MGVDWYSSARRRAVLDWSLPVDDTSGGPSTIGNPPIGEGIGPLPVDDTSRRGRQLGFLRWVGA